MNETQPKSITIASWLFRFFRFLIVIGLACGLAIFLWSLKKEPEKKEIIKVPPSANIVKVFPQSKTMTVEAFGTVKPGKLVKIAAEVPGRIESVHPAFVEGGTFSKGDVLIRIDSRSFSLELQSAKARIDQADADIKNLEQDIVNLNNDLALSKANLALVKKELERTRSLTRNKIASQNALDRSEQQYLQSKIALQSIKNRLASAQTLMEIKKTSSRMARIDLEKARLSLEKSRIQANFDGYVLDKHAEQGEYINPGQMICSVYEKNNLDVDVRIPFEKMKWIETFFENGKMPDAKVTIAGFKSVENTFWDAKVVRIKASVDEKTRTLPMTLEIMNPEVKVKGLFELKPGTFVKCTINGETIDNLFVLPRYLMKTGDTLYTVDQNYLRIKKVGILRKFEDEVYVDSGLKPGEQIISSPLPGALEGMELTIKENGN